METKIKSGIWYEPRNKRKKVEENEYLGNTPLSISFSLSFVSEIKKKVVQIRVVKKKKKKKKKKSRIFPKLPKPRAATSVAIIIVIFPLLKSLITLSLSTCDLSPWIASACQCSLFN